MDAYGRPSARPTLFRSPASPPMDGSLLNCTGSCDDAEQVLDIEVAISMAPGLSELRVYVSNWSDVEPV